LVPQKSNEIRIFNSNVWKVIGDGVGHALSANVSCWKLFTCWGLIKFQLAEHETRLEQYIANLVAYGAGSGDLCSKTFEDDE